MRAPNQGREIFFHGFNYIQHEHGGGPGGCVAIRIILDISSLKSTLKYIEAGKEPRSLKITLSHGINRYTNIPTIPK